MLLRMRPVAELKRGTDLGHRCWTADDLRHTGVTWQGGHSPGRPLERTVCGAPAA